MSLAFVIGVLYSRLFSVATAGKVYVADRMDGRKV